jgi:RNA polymerase primary sigma factor
MLPIHLRHSGRQVSVDAPFSQSEDSKSSLLDIMPNDDQPTPDHRLMSESLRNEIERVLSTLSEKEATVIKLYFGFNTEYTATWRKLVKFLILLGKE